MTTDDSWERRSLCRWICWLLVFISIGCILGRIATVRSKDRRTPFFSANDRSRWCTISAIVDYGTYEIDTVIKRRGWDSIDKVKHVASHDGEEHAYSSKPPLLPTLIAAEYWLIKSVSGRRIEKYPFYIARIMLAVTNVLPLLVYFWLLILMVEELAETEWARIFVVAAACFGTFLTTFAISLNNHLPAAISVLLTLYGLMRIYQAEHAKWRPFFLVGMASAFAAANELPALSFLACALATCFWLSPSMTIKAAIPGVAIVAGAFFGTNYVAHESWKPPYAHRDPGDNWYEYEGSYWMGEKQGVDKGEPSKAVYAFHTLIGHYGVFSLTPIWILSFVGMGQWLFSREQERRYLAALTLLLSVVCLTFYVALRPLEDRNYGGVSCGFRWMFWFIPMYLLTMIPVVDWAANKKKRQAALLFLLLISIFSASYGSSNPWISPWIYEYWKSIGWIAA